MAWRRGKFAFVTIVLQILFLALFAIFVEYDSTTDARKDLSAYTHEYLENYTKAHKDDHDDGHGGGHGGEGPDLAHYYPCKLRKMLYW